MVRVTVVYVLGSRSNLSLFTLEQGIISLRPCGPHSNPKLIHKFYCMYVCMYVIAYTVYSIYSTGINIRVHLMSIIRFRSLLVKFSRTFI